jgi:hypothetical protein
MKHPLIRLVVAASLALAALPVMAGVAEAATPVPGAPFAGTTAHAKFSISVTPECSAAYPLPPVLSCAQPAYVDFVVTPASNAGKHCADAGIAFSAVEIKPGGTFSATADNPGNWYLTVKARSTTPGAPSIASASASRRQSPPSRRASCCRGLAPST